MSSQHLTIPRNAVNYVLFQRTQYLLFRRSSFLQRIKKALPTRIGYALEAFFSYYYIPVTIEGMFTRRTVETLFSQELSFEYESMKAFLPTSAHGILDVGAGIGGIDVFLAKHYASDKPVIHLLDKTQMPAKVYYNYREQGCYYNSMSSSKEFLAANGVIRDNIVLHEVPDSGAVVFPGDLDLIISLISWGFHYPVSTYLSLAFDALKRGGVLIIDVRKTAPGVDGVAEIRQKFGTENVQVVTETSGAVRLAARKNA